MKTFRTPSFSETSKARKQTQNQLKYYFVGDPKNDPKSDQQQPRYAYNFKLENKAGKVL